jgi:DEAD/DEAH box helicase domain-containing protein
MSDRAEELYGLMQWACDTRTSARIVEEFRQPPRDGKFRTLPAEYNDPRIVKAIESLGISPDAIYSSQADALEWAAAGFSPFMTTETASGKSFVFQIAALKKMLDDPEARILVLYPTRALNADQLISWQQMMKAADLPAHKVGLLDGGVSHDKREEIVRDSRILIATPDVIHAWMLSDPGIKTKDVQDFIKNIRLRVIDEAHINDGVFGTKFSYLMRRLTVAQRLLNPEVKTSKEYWENYGQVIAASATISNAEAFLHELTGLPKTKDQQIYVISPEEDGSPRQARHITRVRVHARKVNEVVEPYLGALRRHDPAAKTIIFVDSRKLAETTAARLNETMGDGYAASYKSGYTRDARNDIETDFRNPDSALRVLVATSAAEVGINMLPVQSVLNIGLPDNASSMLQRAGRIRKGGLVAFIERQGKDTVVDRNVVTNAFTRPPRTPTLYRKNEGIQAQMLACLLNEIENITGREPTLADVKLSPWPTSFHQLASDVITGERSLEDVLHRKVPYNTKPQRYFSLRDADAGRARVVLFVPGLKRTITLEELSHLQALNEAYPGATMLHRGDYYRIKKWNDSERSSSFIIHAEPIEKGRLTRSFMNSSLSTNLWFDAKRSAIQLPKMKIGELSRGDFMANVGFIVRTSVGGFTEFQGPISDGNRLGAVFYNKTHELEDGNPCKDMQGPPAYRTWHKGLLVRIQERWFHPESRRQIGRAIIEEYARRRKLSAKDFTLHTDHIEAKYSNNYGYDGDTGYMMAICESSTSDFGLAKDLYNDLPQILIDMTRTHENEDIRRLAWNMYSWTLGLKEVDTPTQDQAARAHLKAAPEGRVLCFEPGSVVTKINPKDPKQRDVVRIKSAKVYEGQVLYEFEPFGDDDNAKSKRAREDFKHSMPMKFFEAQPGFWYSYGYIDLTTGAITPEDYEDADKLLVNVSGKDTYPASLRLGAA